MALEDIDLVLEDVDDLSDWSDVEEQVDRRLEYSAQSLGYYVATKITLLPVEDELSQLASEDQDNRR